MYDQIPAVSVNENKHAHQLQTGLMRCMILKLHGNATPSSCDQRLFFSLGGSRLVDAASPRTINIVKKKRSSGTQGFLYEQLVEQWKRRLCAHSFENMNRPMNTNQSKSTIFIDLEISGKTVQPMKAPKNSTWSYLNEISPHFITNGCDIIYVSLFLSSLVRFLWKGGTAGAPFATPMQWIFLLPVYPSTAGFQRSVWYLS